jgi:hypothetical protein
VLRELPVEISHHQVRTGHIGRGDPDWHYVPFQVPTGVAELAITLAHDGAANQLDLGLFDPRGHDLGDPAGFRGWSGSARRELVVGETAATPGYLPGPIRPGTWHALLGAATVPVGGLDWRLEVRCRPRRRHGLRFTPRPTADRRVLVAAPGWYRGDLHTHTIYSDGRYLPAELAAAARAAGLDYLVSTEHNTSAAHAVWGDCDRPDLLLLNGQEVTTRTGHFGAVGLDAGRLVDWRFRPGDGLLAPTVARLRADGALTVANHPFTFDGDHWQFGFDHVDAIEVWNGATEARANELAITAWDELLRAGRPVVATGGSDAHRAPDPVGRPQTVVGAEQLGRAGVLAGLRAGRVYLAVGPEIAVGLQAAVGDRAGGLGDRLAGRPEEQVAVRLAVRGAPAGEVTLHARDGVAHHAHVPAGEAELRWQAPLGELGYLRAEVRRPGGELVAMTNPLWLPARP